MSHMLLDERPLFVLPSLAEAIGLNEAIILQQLHWCLGRDSVHVDDDGRRWLGATVEFWKREFPFWGEATIKRAFASLVEKGVVDRARRRDDTAFSISYTQLESICTDQPDPGAGPKRSVQPDQSDPSPCKRPGEEREQKENSIGDPDGSPQLFDVPTPKPKSTAPESPVTPEMIESVWTHYAERFGDVLRIKGLTSARERTIRKALIAVGAENEPDAAVNICHAAIDGLQSYRATHPGSTDISTIFSTGPHDRSNLTDKVEWWAGQAQTTLPGRDEGEGASHLIPVDLTGVPSATRGRIEGERRHVMKMLAHPESESAQERGRAALDWLKDRVGHEPIIEDGRLHGWRHA